MSLSISGACMSCSTPLSVPSLLSVRADSLHSVRCLLPQGWLVVGSLPTQGVDLLCPVCAAQLNSEVVDSLRRQAEAYRKEIGYGDGK